MTSIQKSPSTPNDAKMSRREFVRRASAAGIVSAAMVSGGATAVPMIQTPRKGGILRVGSAGGNTTDGLDRRTWIDSVTLVCGFTACNMLVENSQDNAPIPELAESWEAKPGAAEWVFNLRKGVPFSNGKEFEADDAIYSLNLHRGETKSGAAGPMKVIKDIPKLNKHQIRIVLDTGDADLHYALSDYHLIMVPNGYSDWSKLVGTGVMTIERFDPGVSVSFKRQRDYWKPDRG